MRIPLIIKYLGSIFLFLSFFLLISLIIGIFNHEDTILIFSFCVILCALFGLFTNMFVPHFPVINTKEGISIVVLGWFLVCLLGAIPYLLWGGEFSLINAWFESVSGFTTTGSTILNDIESLPKSILFWRSATHWIGGLGIIIFAILILPGKESRGHILLNTELSEIAKQTFNFSGRKILRMLFIVYVGLTLAETILLTVFGMSLFDAVNHSFATVATGGFSTKNLSIAYYDSVPIEVTIMIFMVLSGLHFGLLFQTFAFGPRNILRSTVAKYFIIVLISGVLLVTLNLYLNGYGSFLYSLRFASFQVISLGSTTGFATADSAHWPFFSILLLIYFTIQCACIGSTSGGLKFDRIVIFFKTLSKQIKKTLHPQAIIIKKIDTQSISDNLENQTLVFIILYLLIIFVSTGLLTLMDVDILSAFSGAAATIGNVGPGFERVSSLGNFHNIPSAGKFIYTCNMLIGRLEIFNILLFLSLRKERF